MDSLVGLATAPVQQGRFYGVTIGVVTNIKDPDNLGRVKVKFPWLSDQDESYWARIATPMAGKDRGMFFLPEVDDEVLVAFEQGDIEFPYVLGALWNGQDRPPASHDNGKNNQRLIRSRSGHEIRFDDTQGKESIEIKTHQGHVIRLDDTQGKESIEIRDPKGRNSIMIDAKANKMSLKSDKIEIDAQQDMSITSGGKLKIKAKMVEIN